MSTIRIPIVQTSDGTNPAEDALDYIEKSIGEVGGIIRVPIMPTGYGPIIQVGLQPAPVAADFTWVDTDLAVTFTDASTGAISAWAWNFGDGNTSTAQNPSHTYAADGTYTVTLAVTGTHGPTATAAQSITVSQTVTPWTPSGIFGGTRWGGLYQWNGADAWTELVNPAGNYGDIYGVVELAGKIYGGCDDGYLLEYDHANSAWIEVAQPLNGESIGSLIVRSGVIYGGTWGGNLYRWDGTSAWENVTSNPSGWVETLSVSAANDIYAGMGNPARLFRWNPSAEAWVDETGALGSGLGDLGEQTAAIGVAPYLGDVYVSTYYGCDLYKWDGATTQLIDGPGATAATGLSYPYRARANPNGVYALGYNRIQLLKYDSVNADWDVLGEVADSNVDSNAIALLEENGVFWTAGTGDGCLWKWIGAWTQVAPSLGFTGIYSLLKV